MEPTYWQRQETDRPLFPDLLWSRPEQKSTAGKLLIIGGNLHAFAAPAEAYSEAEKAGIGTVRVILPSATKKIVGRIMEHVEYAPSTPSGSFNQQALVELLDLAAWSDGVLIAGDLGRNSETAILLEKFAHEYTGQLTLAKDAADYIITSPETVKSRENTLLVLSVAQLQKLATTLGFGKAFTYNMNILLFIESLHEFTKNYAPHIIIKHQDQIHCAVNGQVISAKSEKAPDIWRVRTAAHASVWWIQNPGKALEAYAASLLG